MKKIYLIAVLVFTTTTILKAQNHNTLWCDKDKKLKNTHHVMQQKTVKPGELIFKVKWGDLKVVLH